MREGAFRRTEEACAFGEEIDFHNDEWELSRPRTSPDWFEKERLAKKKLAEKMLAEACRLEAKARNHAKRRQSDVIMKLLQVGDLTAKQEIDNEIYEAPSRIYLRNLKPWEKRLTRLLNLRGVQNEHWWQVALDCVRQQTTLYSKWIFTVELGS
eukprot:Blabericola_migrator_1__5269@NODE_2706_length_2441_cov_8_833193_g1693_i0_p2_GENE_NODE_2706_length_2441_cov_8_833193_g1693_i0NODE_2706_length_2441_cov_8_833193_g1693_i0_p2_ORF_typecomplete_len154_score26_13_NODE_2706_length_2441_cov_8_833193_g1693_i015592020